MVGGDGDGQGGRGGVIGSGDGGVAVRPRPNDHRRVRISPPAVRESGRRVDGDRPRVLVRLRPVQDYVHAGGGCQGVVFVVVDGHRRPGYGTGHRTLESAAHDDRPVRRLVGEIVNRG